VRLWHIDLLPYLPNLQLVGQHRECCALRGKGWGRKHSTVNYVFSHPYSWLYDYHLEVMRKMRYRGYNHDKRWLARAYRGNNLGYDHTDFVTGIPNRYPEHNAEYLAECIKNLQTKGVSIRIVT